MYFAQSSFCIHEWCVLSLMDKDGNGTQFSQSEACFEKTAFKRALSSVVLADCMRFSDIFLHNEISHAALTDFRTGNSYPLSRYSCLSEKKGFQPLLKKSASKGVMCSEVADTEVRYAGSDISDADLIPMI